MKINKMESKLKALLIAGLLSFGIGGSFTSCNFLDIDPYINDMFNLDTVFSKKEYCLKYLYNVYSYLPNTGDFRKSPWVPVTDECFVSYKQGNHAYNYFANNVWEASDEYHLNFWPTYYEGIRKVNTFLKRVYECDELSTYNCRKVLLRHNFYGLIFTLS